MAKKESTPLNLNSNNLPGGSSQIDFNDTEINVSVDQELVNSLQKELEDRRKENREKLYAISMNESLLRRYEEFVKEKAEWNSTEALGVVEVYKQIQGVEDANNFIELYRSFDQVLKDVKTDNQIVQDLEKKLSAAMQGISLG